MLFLIVVIRFIDIGATNLCRVSAAECINGKVNYTHTYTYMYTYNHCMCSTIWSLSNRPIPISIMYNFQITIDLALYNCRLTIDIDVG